MTGINKSEKSPLVKLALQSPTRAGKQGEGVRKWYYFRVVMSLRMVSIPAPCKVLHQTLSRSVCKSSEASDEGLVAGGLEEL